MGSKTPQIISHKPKSINQNHKYKKNKKPQDHSILSINLHQDINNVFIIIKKKL